jgi:peptidoglycan biosynthesis protein MviN/MurJ (putative lipid II flippase)
MGATLLSRILGVVRDIVLTNKFGTNDDYAAYLAAFRIPDTLYLLIIGGALGSSLIPVFSRFLGRGDRENAWRLANAVVNYSMLTLAVCSALAWLFAPAIVSTILAPNFPEATKQLTTDLTRLLLLQPFFMGLGGIALALLNGSENFVWPAVAPLIYNLSIIGGALFLTGPFGYHRLLSLPAGPDTDPLPARFLFPPFPGQPGSRRGPGLAGLATAPVRSGRFPGQLLCRDQPGVRPRPGASPCGRLQHGL